MIKNKCILPFGMGTNWTIIKNTRFDLSTYYTFTLFDYSNKGFRFNVEEKDIRSFGEYFLGCCEYMLAHGDPI